MFEKFLQVIYVGIITPVLYVLYSIGVILLTFIFGLPIAIGFHLIKIAISQIFPESVSY